MEKQRFYFGFRFENGMKKRLLEQMFQQRMRLNRFVEDALRFAARLHDKGQLPFAWKSVFITRPDRRNRFDTMLILNHDVHEMVRNLAFAYRRSMAEVLRVALEVYLDFLESPNGKLDNLLHYYSKPMSVINTVTARLIPAFLNGIPPNKYNIYTYLYKK